MEKPRWPSRKEQELVLQKLRQLKEPGMVGSPTGMDGSYKLVGPMGDEGIAAAKRFLAQFAKDGRESAITLSTQRMFPGRAKKSGFLMCTVALPFDALDIQKLDEALATKQIRAEHPFVARLQAQREAIAPRER